MYYDVMGFPLSSHLSSLRYHEPTREFRTQFEYNNYMFLLAGHIAEKLTGSAWEDLVESRIFQPLGMVSSTFVTRIQDWDRLASSYGSIDGVLRLVNKTLTRYAIYNKYLTMYVHLTMYAHITMYVHLTMYAHITMYAHLTIYVHITMYAHLTMYAHITMYAHLTIYVHITMYAHLTMYAHITKYAHITMYAHLTMYAHITKYAHINMYAH